MIREFSAAALQGCRDKALQRTSAFMAQIPEGATDAQKFDLLKDQWGKVLSCSQKCGENFDPELFVERDNNQIPNERLKDLLETYMVGLYRMDALVAEMDKLPCTKINGTSVAFAICAKQTNQIEIDMGRALIVYQTGPFSIYNVNDVDAPPAPHA